jgi:hypothetical protein
MGEKAADDGIRGAEMETARNIALHPGWRELSMFLHRRIFRSSDVSAVLRIADSRKLSSFQHKGW